MASTSLPSGDLTPVPVHIIAPAQGWVGLRLREIWEYRELLYFLVWREVSIRYKQTVLGMAWAVIQPVFAMVVFTIFFGWLGRMPSDGQPYPVFTYAALLPWTLFAYALTEASNSVVANQRVITKVYFPRLILPMAAVCVGLVDFAIAFGVLLLLLPFYGVQPGWAALAVPFFTAMAVLAAFSVGVWLSALNVRYRDIRHTLPFLVQIWLFATPVVYPSSLVPGPWRALYAINPMVGVVDGFRWALLGAGSIPILTVAVSSVVLAAVLVSGLFYFRRTERTFADVI
ncbi:MAG TPA: ABC transporter permease [Vicinamibacterales bacterium]|nr:ABC transporter permease [Vicinamibacterales bacterium]